MKQTFTLILAICFSTALAATLCIEFGTSGSAYSVSTNLDFLESDKWPKGNGNIKVPSVVSWGAGTGEPKFGFEALELHRMFSSPMLARNLKLELRNKTNFPAHAMIQQFINYMVQIAYEHIRIGEINDAPIEKLQYIATIPAMWEEFENNIMRSVFRNTGTTFFTG